MKKWLLLAGAILAETTGTLALRAAVDHSAWTALVVGAYIAAFTLLGLVLRERMPVGVAYGIWTAIGIVLVALFARGIWKDPVTNRMMVGMVLIIAGVFLIELG